MNAFALDLRPLVDDGEDQEAEDDRREADLEGEADAAAARRTGPEPRSGLAHAVQEWLAALHVGHLSDEPSAAPLAPPPRRAGPVLG